MASLFPAHESEGRDQSRCNVGITAFRELFEERVALPGIVGKECAPDHLLNGLGGFGGELSGRRENNQQGEHDGQPSQRPPGHRKSGRGWCDLCTGIPAGKADYTYLS